MVRYMMRREETYIGRKVLKMDLTGKKRRGETKEKVYEHGKG